MHEERRLRKILEMISSYSAKVPLSVFLQQHYRRNRQMGASDRRLATGMSYAWFRLRHALAGLPEEEIAAVAAFVMLEGPNRFADTIVEDHTRLLPADRQLPLEGRLEAVRARYPAFTPDAVFPFTHLLSDRIGREAFLRGFLRQPLVWVRVREGFREAVLDEWKRLGIDCVDADGDALAVPPGTALDKTESFALGRFDIQDLASQHTLDGVDPAAGESWWDACAASGGKSLLLLSRQPGVTLTVTDVRASVLRNLGDRFRKAGLVQPETFVADLTGPGDPAWAGGRMFDGILADVPCSGSGTWSRTPERLSAFSAGELPGYHERQVRIARRCAERLRPGGLLVYITCSVFREENEAVAEKLPALCALECLEERYLEYAGRGADTMFVSLFRKKPGAA
jgi:16S rRNA (cytosine967-C5)-methyltransferase